MNSFIKKKTGQCCWMLGFRTLCNIKAMMMEFEKKSILGEPRYVIDEIWSTLKVDKKWLKKEYSNNKHYDNNDDDCNAEDIVDCSNGGVCNINSNIGNLL